MGACVGAGAGSGAAEGEGMGGCPRSRRFLETSGKKSRSAAQRGRRKRPKREETEPGSVALLPVCVECPPMGAREVSGPFEAFDGVSGPPVTWLPPGT